jgi:hypothetical protein
MKIPLLASLAGLLGLFLFRQQHGAVELSTESLKNNIETSAESLKNNVEELLQIDNDSIMSSDEEVSDRELDFSEDDLE